MVHSLHGVTYHHLNSNPLLLFEIFTKLVNLSSVSQLRKMQRYSKRVQPGALLPYFVVCYIQIEVQ